MLSIFPEGSLAGSVVTTVWVGMFVIVFFNLRFGWSLSGLVVPGYLVPLLIVRPFSAGIVVVEAILTWAIVAGWSALGPRTGLWHSLFGRDRFFALILVAVIVRLCLDGYALPYMADWLQAQGLGELDYHLNLQSFGLVIVALLANLFWHAGLGRGLPPMLITLGITYVLVRYGLMEYTNFSMGRLGYMYEDMAASVLASPKAYIVLLVTAALASRMNLRYGWDFNGILLPSLLALQWYTPGKILATFVEAWVILLLARLLLRSPIFANRHIEGGRQLLLFFNISFLYKLLLSYALLLFAPEVKISDYYGFGYLLATLLAMRMYEKDLAIGMFRTTAQTSLVAVLLATAIGFSLTLLPQGIPAPATAAMARSAESPLPDDPVQALRDDKLLLYQARTNERRRTPSAAEQAAFAEALTLLDVDTDSSIARARELLATAGFQLRLLDHRYWYLRGPAGGASAGLFLIDRQASSPLLVSAPGAGQHYGFADAGVRLFRHLQGRALALEGPIPSWALGRRRLFDLFREHYGAGQELQLRRASLGAESALWIKQQLPRQLNLDALLQLLADGEQQPTVHWRRPDEPSGWRRRADPGFAELLLNADGLRRLLGRTAVSGPAPISVDAQQRIDGYLRQWLLGGKRRLAPRGSGEYQPIGLDELLFLDAELLQPLLQLSRKFYGPNDWQPGALRSLSELDETAARFGYRLIRYRHAASGQQYLILSEPLDRPPQRHWGTYVFRLGSARPFIIEIPRPLHDLGSFELGVTLFERMRASALLIAGSHPHANLDGSANVLRPGNAQTLFNLVNQVLLREAGGRQLLLQTRSFASDAAQQGQALDNVDLLIAFQDGQHPDRQLNRLGSELLSDLREDGLRYRIIDGQLSTAGYEIGFNAQDQYRDATSGHDFAVLRLAAGARLAWQPQSRHRLQDAQFRALGLTTEEQDIGAWLPEQIETLDERLPVELDTLLTAYQSEADIVQLAELTRRWPKLTVSRIIDRDSRQAFLLLRDSADQPRRLLHLTPRAADAVLEAWDKQSASEQLERLLRRRAGLLRIGAAS